MLMVCFCIFDFWMIRPRGVAAPAMIEDRWRRLARLVLVWSLALGLISGAAWLLLASLNMSDWEPGQSFPWSAVGIVWRETQFGHLWQARLGLWIIACFCAAMVLLGARRDGKRLRKWRAGVMFLPAAALLGSLAWAGHGTEGSPYALHVGADVLHLLICAAWPTSLFPLIVLLVTARKLSVQERQSFIPTFVARFSAMSLVAVTLLVASGIVNSLFLLGAWSNFLSTSYGRLLLGKIAMTAAAIALGAINLLVLGRRVARSNRAQCMLRMNVSVELTLAVLIILVVGWLGLMQPGTR